MQLRCLIAFALIGAIFAQATAVPTPISSAFQGNKKADISHAPSHAKLTRFHPTDGSVRPSELRLQCLGPSSDADCLARLGHAMEHLAPIRLAFARAMAWQHTRLRL